MSGPAPKLYTHDGHTLSVKEWAEHLDLCPKAIWRRLRQGFPIALALSTEPLAIHRTITANGETAILAEWSRRAGMTGNTIAQRLERGEEPDHAVTRPADQGRTPLPNAIRNTRDGRVATLHTHDGVTLTLAQWAERSGIKLATLRHRLGKGVPMQRALDPKPFTPGRRRHPRWIGTASAPDRTTGGGVQTSVSPKGPAGEAPRDIPAI